MIHESLITDFCQTLSNSVSCKLATTQWARLSHSSSCLTFWNTFLLSLFFLCTGCSSYHLWMIVIHPIPQEAPSVRGALSFLPSPADLPTIPRLSYLFRLFAWTLATDQRVHTATSLAVNLFLPFFYYFAFLVCRLSTASLTLAALHQFNTYTLLYSTND
jgi:hypothetical protein